MVPQVEAIFLVLIGLGKSGLLIRVIAVICLERTAFSLVFVPVIFVRVVVIPVFFIFLIFFIVLSVFFIIVIFPIILVHVTIVVLRILIFGFLGELADMVLLHEGIVDGNTALR